MNLPTYIVIDKVIRKIRIRVLGQVIHPKPVKPPKYSYYDFLSKLSSNEDVKFCRYQDYDFIHEKEMFLFRKEDIEKTKNIFIRHDVDHDPFLALEMAKIEAELGIKSVYYFLTTDSYFATKFWKKKKDDFLRVVRSIQKLGHEVGLHYDFFGDYYSKGKDPKENLEEILQAFVKAGINITGCASHGSSRVHKLIRAERIEGFPRQFVNYSIWKEVCRDEGEYQLNNRKLTVPCASLFNNQIKYEAYFVQRNYYDSDSGGNIWTFGEPLEKVREMNKGESFCILVHPIWWSHYLR